MMRSIYEVNTLESLGVTKIESIAIQLSSVGATLFIGTIEGQLLLYEIRKVSNECKY